MTSHVGKARFGTGTIAAALLLSAFGVQAQVQRSFVNLGFEEPNLETTGCRVYIGDQFVPGWSTSHPAYGQENAGGCVVPPGFVVGQPAPIIEIWKTPRQGVDARSGTQLAELNAEVVSRISQNVCLESDEQVSWRFSHRGRNSTTVQDVMEFLIGADPIVRVGTTSSGAGGVITTNQGVAGSVAGPGGWRDYSGAFTYSGAAGITNLGFEAISAAGGATAGNFLDEISLSIRPYIEFSAAQTFTPEGQATGIPSLRIAGVIEAGINVSVAITGGTAVLGTDFSAPGISFIVNIPAGDYGTGQEFPLPLSALDNAIIQDNRTVMLSVEEDPANYLVGNTSVCGAPANGNTEWVVVDNDVDLLATKVVDPATVPAGEAFEYTVTFANNTARPTVAPLDAHDATAEVSDALPAGLAFDSWTCQAGNGASCPGGAPDGSTSGSGAISGSAFLPAGDGAAGGQLVYTITASFVDPQNCDAVTNTATIATPPDLQEGETADPGFGTPLPGGSANNSASVDVQVACADLQIEKSVSPDDVQPGDEVVYTLLVTNNGPQAADGALVTDAGVPGSLDCTALACSATGGVACPVSPTPTQLAAGLAIPVFPVDGVVTLELTCTVTATGN